MDAELGLPTLTGFENHMGVTQPRPRRQAAVPDGRRGIGNGDGYEGCYAATSSAPTCTARRWPATRPWPTCCSRWRAGELAPLDDTRYEQLRQERLNAVLAQ